MERETDFDGYIIFEPIYKRFIWGGTRIKEYFNKRSKCQLLQKAGKYLQNEAGLGEILNEDMKGLTLKELFDNKRNKKRSIWN